jgi:hypothetical protein
MASCAYLLPLRRTSFSRSEAIEWRDYIETLGQAGCTVITVDGSPPEIFAQHAAILGASCFHIPVDPSFGFLNDKVNAIYSGVAFAQPEKIILGDDDIRYGPTTVAEVLQLLDSYEVVRPQNFLAPLPWWGRMESARMLINRATLRAADYPGTCAFRRSTFQRVGYYDGDVLFDNEEMIRHFAERGAIISFATDLFVRKRPPRFRKWLEQRPRQAYEDFGLRIKTSLFLAIVPLGIVITLLFGSRAASLYLILLTLVSIAIAFRGWARGRAREVMPVSSIFFAPVWIAERSLSTYTALYWYFAHRGYPFGAQLLSKGIGRDWREGGRRAAEQMRRNVPRPRQNGSDAVD